MTRPTPSEPMDWERPSERFLAYLGRLSRACVERDREQLDKLMRMRLSSHLPRAVLDELEFFRRSRANNLRAPLKLMRYVHKMQQLATAPAEKTQLPLELRERGLTAPPAPPPAASTRRRSTPHSSDAQEPE
jgi:hypothetical protein